MNSAISTAMERLQGFVLTESRDNFKNLVRAVGLDHKTGLRFNNWSELSFADQNLKECDFTGAILNKCDFAGAHVLGARFEGAVLGIKGEVARTDLSLAADWAEHCEAWTRQGEVESDRHLDELEYFQDAPFAPVLVVLPVGPARIVSGDRVRTIVQTTRVAVAELPLTLEQLRFYQARNPSELPWLADFDDTFKCPPLSWHEGERYVRWLSQQTGRRYRVVSDGEWNIGVHSDVLKATVGLEKDGLFEWVTDHWREELPEVQQGTMPWLGGDPNTRTQRDFGADDDPASRNSGEINERVVAKVRVARALVR